MSVRITRISVKQQQRGHLGWMAVASSIVTAIAKLENTNNKAQCKKQLGCLTDLRSDLIAILILTLTRIPILILLVCRRFVCGQGTIAGWGWRWFG